MYGQYNNERYPQEFQFGENGILYIYEHYFIIFNQKNVDMCWLAISHNFENCLLLSGKCELNIIRGSLIINGVNFSSPFNENIYSPLSHAKITFQIKQNENFCKFDQLITLLVDGDNEFEMNLRNLFNINYQSFYVRNWNLIKLTSFVNRTVEDLLQFKEFKTLFNVDINFPLANKLKFSLTHQENPDYVITKGMKMSLNNLKEFGENSNDLKVALVGPKNSGKSSFLKTLTNELFVNGFKEIYILDGDPGQSEFSTCGCLSLTVVSQPLLGPPFTHQFSEKIKIIEQYLLGLVSPNDDPKLYCRSFERLYQKYLSICSVNPKPLIINTMGWPNGVGLMLLAFKLLLVNPSHIIQLKKGRSNQDLVNITPKLLENLCMEGNSLLRNLKREISSTIIILESPVLQNQHPKLKLNAQRHRELSILSYLFHQIQNRPSYPEYLLQPDHNSNPVSRLRCHLPVTMKFRHFLNNTESDEIDYVYLKIIYSDSNNIDQLDFLINCFLEQWVGICLPAEPCFYQSVISRSPYENCRNNELELMRCFGMCFVSHIRRDTNEINLLTGLDQSILNGCCLIKGKIPSPETLILNQREVIAKHNNISLTFVSPQIPVGIGRTAIPTRKSLPKVRRHQHHN